MSYTNELYHHGIKGQKWGVRRFQNKDGSLTKLGQKRADKQARAAAKAAEKKASRGPYSLETKFESIAGETVRSKRSKSGVRDIGSGLATIGIGAATTYAMSKGMHDNKQGLFTGGKKGAPAEKMLNTAKNFADTASRGIEQRANKRATKDAAKIDLSKASDQEIRDYVNRYNLEKQFKQITAEQYSSGKSKTKAIIDAIGTTAAVAGSIATIVVAYNQIRNPGS